MKLGYLSHWKKLRTSLISVLLICVLMVPMAVSEINSTGTYFWVNPPGNIVKGIGASFDVAINVTAAPVNDTRAWSLTLEWSNTTLKITGVEEGTFLKKVGATNFFNESLVDAQKKGSMGVGCILQGAPATLAGGSGWLCNVTFQVLASGSSPLNLKDTKLTNRAGVSKDYPNNDGFFATATPVDDVRITGITVNATQVQQGKWVQINVTVHNEGSAAQTFDVKAYADLVTHDPADPDTVDVGDEILIGTQTGINLGAGASTKLTFIWDTASVRGEKWTISAEVINSGEEDPHDNIFIGPVVHVICPHDVKVTGVTVINATVSRGKIAKVNVTVVNEGQNTESFNVTLYANTTLIGWLTTNATLVVNASTTRTFNWNTTGVALGTYTIKAIVPAVGGEKDTVDNTLIDGTIDVVFYDVWVKSIQVLDVCNPEGMNPIVYFEINATNVGTEMMKFDLYVIADPNLAVSGDEIVCGYIYVSLLDPGENRTFTSILPYGGWNTMVPSIKAPANVPVPGTTYNFIAFPKPWPGYRDDNPANDKALRLDWTLPLVTRDVKVTSVKGTSKVAVGDIAKVNVTVSNQGQFNDENVNVTLRVDGTPVNSTTTTIPKMEWITFVNATGFPATNVTWVQGLEGSAIPLWTPRWYVYNKTLGGKLMGSIDYPANNTWWRLMFPPTPALYYDPVPVNILIDQVIWNATAKVYKFRVALCRKGTSDYAVQLATVTTPKGYPAVIAWKTESKTVTISWWTAGWAVGDHTISANATIIGAADGDPCDNARIDGKIKLVDHDVGVVSIVAAKPYAGFPVYITITIKNKGNYKENITVTVYFDNATHQLSTTYKITNLEVGMTHTNSSISFGSEPTCGLIWHAFITVNATITTPLVTDQDLSDNERSDNLIVSVRIAGDINGSGKVTWEDLGLLGMAYGSKPGDPNWNPEADFNASGKVTWEDLGILGLNYGKSC